MVNGVRQNAGLLWVPTALGIFGEYAPPPAHVVRIATLEAENVTLRAQLSAAQEALAGVTIAQKAEASCVFSRRN
jgi:hypothetical protein